MLLQERSILLTVCSKIRQGRDTFTSKLVISFPTPSGAHVYTSLSTTILKAYVAIQSYRI
jgi:hypothetical protein